MNEFLHRLVTIVYVFCIVDFPDADGDEATEDDPNNSEDIWGVCDGRTLHKFSFQVLKDTVINER